MKSKIITMLMLIAATVAMAQGDDKNITVSGYICDAATGEPLAGVRVEAYGDNRYTAMTDENGQYVLKAPRWVSSVMMTVEGYNPQQTPVGTDRSNVDARMYTAAFGAQYGRTATARVERKAAINGLTSDVSVDPAISERLGADVRSIPRGANPGLGNAMFIGGFSSLQGNAQPLIVIDGVVTDMQYSRSLLHDGYYNNLLSNINIEDIEDVRVLKNGTAIYGSKGANGVILINTKRNKSMATRIDVNINGGFQMIPRLPRMMEAEEYRLYATELLANQTANVGKMRFLNTDPSYYYYNWFHNNTDWTKETYRTAWTQNYSINVQGGDDVASYNLSVGYSQANSTLRGNDYSRFNMRLNTDIDIVRNLSVRFDAAYSDVNRDLRDDGLRADLSAFTVTSPGILGLIKAPFLSPYAYDTSGRLSSYLSGADDYLSDVFDDNEGSLANPNSILEFGDGTNRNTFGNRMIVLSITPKYQFNKHLVLSEHFNFSLVNTNESYYLPMEGVPEFKMADITTSTLHNLVQSLAGRENFIQSDTRLDWNNRYAMHTVRVIGGVRYISNNYKLTTLRGFNTGNDKTPNPSTALAYKQTGGSDDKSREITWYAQADYNYAERYYLSAGASMHTSSRFGKDAPGLRLGGVAWGLFPSVQAAWVVTNEKWFAAAPAINYLRLNVGYDVTGNDDLDYTSSRSYFVSNAMLDNTASGKTLGNIGNTELKWETTRRFTAGAEANLLDNRLSLRFNLFKSWTSNLLTLRQLAYTSGLAVNWSNDGKLENTGFDAAFNVRMLNLKDWKWELGASVGHYKNKITALPEGNAPIENTVYGATILTAVGKPAGLFYGYRTEGLFTTQAEAEAAALYVLDESGKRQYFEGGDMRFADTDGNHCIDEADREVIGDPNPDIYGNISTALTWKRWRLEAMINYSLGNDVYNYQRSVLEGGNRFYNQTTAMANRWTTDGQQTSIPRVSYGDPLGNSRFSDRWIEDGSYLRLRSVTLSYTWPIQSTYLQGITIWGSGQNLFTVTKYLGTDPAVSAGNGVLSQGIDCGLIGAGRAFSLGVRINL